MSAGAVALAFGVAFLSVLLATPVVIRFSARHGLYDRVDDRKSHVGEKSRLGGVGMLVGLVLAMAAGLVVDGRYTVSKALALSAGFIPIFAVSLWDDLRSRPWWLKLLAQTAGSIVFAVGAGEHYARVNLPFVGTFNIGAWSYVVIVLWLLLTTNAMNMIDGLDGLAAGLAAIAGSVLAVASWRNGFVLPTVLAAAVVGICLGFLPYNFPPARVFMGDAGATLLGFSLGASALTGAGKNVAVVSMLIPLLALAIPLLDVVGAVARRSYRGRSIFEADQQHVHHVLLSAGISERRTLVLLYGVAAVLGMGALFLSGAPRSVALLLVVVSTLFLSLLLKRRFTRR
jgi:UDP-GlcNAc:undecaprenyl-phosphate/decaprenyl-phosphate GlcNAc-1-phosphate transferase